MSWKFQFRTGQFAGSGDLSPIHAGIRELKGGIATIFCLGERASLGHFDSNMKHVAVVFYTLGPNGAGLVPEIQLGTNFRR